MRVKVHNVGDTKIAEIISDDRYFNSIENELDLLGDLYYQGFDAIAIRETNIASDFFHLKNGIAGEILQKFSNYKVRLSIIGDFSKYKSKSLAAFIVESNRGNNISFVTTLDDALQKLK